MPTSSTTPRIALFPGGPGTIALEILDRAPDVARIVVAVGDTALIRGVAAVAKAQRPEVRITGVQAERAPAYTLSWEAGRPVPTDTCDTIADGLATRTPVGSNVETIRALVDDFVLVSEDEPSIPIHQLDLERTEPPVDGERGLDRNRHQLARVPEAGGNVHGPLGQDDGATGLVTLQPERGIESGVGSRSEAHRGEEDGKDRHGDLRFGSRGRGSCH